MKRPLLIFVAILLAALTLRVWNLAGPDMANDEAHYAFRSIGYLDYVAAINRQSTPVTWFDESQWWQRLSFHDAPPLVFAVQHAFIALAGDSVIVTRLPFILAGLAALGAVFLFAQHLNGIGAGLIAAAALALVNHHVWISRIGYLDGFLVLWIPLSLLFFLKAETDGRNYLWWGAAAAAGILTKYTFFFMGPVFLGVLLTTPRRAWQQKYFWAGAALLVVALSPLIAYNIQMWRSRGHPDAALSTMLGMAPEDFQGLSRAVNTNPLANLDIFASIGGQMSIGFVLLFLTAIGMGIFFAARHTELRRPYGILLGGLLSALLMLTAIGDHERYGVVVLPFLAIITGLVGIRIWKAARERMKIAIAVFVFLAASWEAVFSVQSQLMARPLIAHPLFFTHVGVGRAGYRELDAYLENFYRQFPEPSDIVIYAAAPQLRDYQERRILARNIPPDAPRQRHLLVFDDRMEWAPSVWIFERRRLYDAAPIHSLTQFLDTVAARGVAPYADFGLADATFIVAADAVTEGKSHPHPLAAEFLRRLTSSVEPMDVIRRPDGAPAFRVFRAPLQ
ncbi:MAG: glycosyltransferase family 39 protein [Patescibacteria group bacterium]